MENCAPIIVPPQKKTGPGFSAAVALGYRTREICYRAREIMPHVVIKFASGVKIVGFTLYFCTF